MNLEAFRIATRRTASPDGDKLEVLALGMIGEASEFAEALLDGAPREGLINELGDMLWYTARVSDVLGLTVFTPIDDPILEHPHVLALRLGVAASKFTELVKKKREGKDVVDFFPRASAALKKVMILLRDNAEQFFTSLEALADANQRKLALRYPPKTI